MQNTPTSKPIPGAATHAYQVDIARSLVWHGALLSFLGLISGFTPFFAPAPRAALSAHTIGVLQGAMLFGLAGAWHLFRTSDRMQRAIKYTLLAGFYANWLGAQLAAFWSAARDMFIAPHAANMPDGAAPWMNLTVAVLLNISALILVSCLLILWIMRRGPQH